jgi:hypothetical protein
MTKDETHASPEAPLPAWSPWFCAFAMGMVGMNVALVTLVPGALSRPMTNLTNWTPMLAIYRAAGWLVAGFVAGACVGLIAGIQRHATDSLRRKP